MKKRVTPAGIATWTVNYIILLFTVIVSIFPIIWVAISSFKSNKEILSNPFTLPTSISFEAYRLVLVQTDFARYFFNTVTISLTASTVALLIYALTGYTFAKFNFRGKNLIFALFAMTLLVPGHTKAQPIFALVNMLGLYDTIWALVVTYISGGLAISLFILRSTFQTIPREMDEAGMIEGASFWQTFWYINIPLARAGLSTAWILMFLSNWNEFFYVIMLVSSKVNWTLSVAVQTFTEGFSYNYTLMFAAITMTLLPSIIFYLCLQEQVQESIASSGIKG